MAHAGPILVFCNPMAAKARRKPRLISKITSLIASAGRAHEVVFSRADGSEGKEFLSKLPLCESVVAVGGDGTINRVVSYLLKHNVTLPVATIPLGTANVFALENDIPLGVEEAVDCLFHGREKMVDVGLVETETDSLYFILMVSVGFDAQTVKDVTPSLKKKLGKASFLLLGLRNMIRYKFTPVSVVDGDAQVLCGHTIVASNTRFYGGRFSLAHEAAVDDGLLDLCAFNTRTRLGLIYEILKIVAGLRSGPTSMTYKKMRSARLDGPRNTKIPFQIDGETCGFLPIQIRVLEKRIPFLIPEVLY